MGCDKCVSVPPHAIDLPRKAPEETRTLISASGHLCAVLQGSGAHSMCAS